MGVVCLEHRVQLSLGSVLQMTCVWNTVLGANEKNQWPIAWALQALGLLKERFVMCEQRYKCICLLSLY